MLKKIGLLCLGFLFFGVINTANAVVIDQTLYQTAAEELLVYNFTGLPGSDGTNGFITVASGSGDSFDLSNQSSEYFDLIFDGATGGRYSCNNHVGINMGCGGSTNQDTFSLVLSFSDILSDFTIDIPDLIADGSLDIGVEFGSGADPGIGGSANQLDMTLAYNNYVPEDPEEPEYNNVPEPGTIALLGLGLAALGFARKKKT